MTIGKSRHYYGDNHSTSTGKLKFCTYLVQDTLSLERNLLCIKTVQTKDDTGGQNTNRKEASIYTEWNYGLTELSSVLLYTLELAFGIFSDASKNVHVFTKC